MQNDKNILKLLPRIERRLIKILKWLNIVCGVVIVIMMAIDTIDVAGRLTLNIPLYGTYEMIALGLILAATWGMGAMESQRGHIRVDLIVKRLPEKPQKVIDIFGYLILLCVFGVMTWQVFTKAFHIIIFREISVTTIMELSEAPFYIILGIGVGMYCLIVLVHLLESLGGVSK